MLSLLRTNLRKNKLYINLNLPKMEKAEISEKVKAIIVDKLGVEASEVTPEASFSNDLGADSLDTVELIMELEKEFGISVPEDQADKLQTVADVENYIAANTK